MNIGKIREFVKSRSGIEFNVHILPAHKYAMQLAEIKNVDKEVVELAVLLHDIGRIKIGPKNHEVTGAEEAEKILKKYNYSQNTIEKVKNCILTHRAKDRKPKTLEAKIIATADVMAHFDSIPWLLYISVKNRNEKESFQWVYEKILRDWESKILIPEGKELIKDKYMAFKVIFESMKEYLE